MNTKQIIINSIEVKKQILESEELIRDIERTAQLAVETFRAGGKVLFCGNGGSAADAQHIAAELSGRFNYDRPPLYAEALHVNSSFMTAVANDYSYDEVYARMVEAAGRKGDMLFALSTSGNSTNVVRAAQRAAKLGLTTIGMTGITGGQLKETCTLTIRVPSDNTARVQESHILIGHILCSIIESTLFPA